MAARYATTAEVLALPGIDAAAESAIDVFLPIAQHRICLGAWGNLASDGHRFLTAHMLLALAGPDGSGASSPDGLVASEANGPASRSFAQATVDPSDAELSSTSYGRQFLALQRIVQGRGRAVVVNPLISQRCR